MSKASTKAYAGKWQPVWTLLCQRQKLSKMVHIPTVESLDALGICKAFQRLGLHGMPGLVLLNANPRNHKIKTCL